MEYLEQEVERKTDLEQHLAVISAAVLAERQRQAVELGLTVEDIRLSAMELMQIDAQVSGTSMPSSTQ